MVIICAVVTASLYNLSLQNPENSTLWTALLSSCMGYALSGGKLKRKKSTSKKKKKKKKKYAKTFMLDIQNDDLNHKPASLPNPT